MFCVLFFVINFFSINLEVWNQEYEFYVGGYKIFDIMLKVYYILLVDNFFVILLDVCFMWDDIQMKVVLMYLQIFIIVIGDFLVFIKGKLLVKILFL